MFHFFRTTLLVVVIFIILNRFFVVIDGIIFTFWTFSAFYQLVIDIRIIGDHSLQFGITMWTFHV